LDTLSRSVYDFLPFLLQIFAQNFARYCFLWLPFFFFSILLLSIFPIIFITWHTIFIISLFILCLSPLERQCHENRNFVCLSTAIFSGAWILSGSQIIFTEGVNKYEKY
jgi:hypothetical protein